MPMKMKNDLKDDLLPKLLAVGQKGPGRVEMRSEVVPLGCFEVSHRKAPIALGGVPVFGHILGRHGKYP